MLRHAAGSAAPTGGDTPPPARGDLLSSHLQPPAALGSGAAGSTRDPGPAVRVRLLLPLPGGPDRGPPAAAPGHAAGLADGTLQL